jgi:hypothetical protein
MRNCRSHLPARAKRRNPAVFAALLGTAHARGMIRRRGRRSHSIITYSIIHLLTAAYSIQPYFALYIIVDHQARPCMSPMTRAIYSIYRVQCTRLVHAACASGQYRRGPAALVARGAAQGGAWLSCAATSSCSGASSSGNAQQSHRSNSVHPAGCSHTAAL